jgi:hypothetical protein
VSRRTRRRVSALLIAGFVALVCVASVAQTSTRASTSAVSMPPSTFTAATPSSPTGVQLTPASPAPFASPPSGATSPGSGSTWVAPWDIPELIAQAITGWFSGLAVSALNPLLDLLGTTVLATPDVTQPGRVSELWGVAAGIADSLLVLLVIAGGVLVMTHETLQTRYSAKEIAPRIVVAAIIANTSLAIAGVAISFCNSLAQAFLGQGVDPASAVATLRSLIEAPLASGSIFLVLLGLVLAVLAVVLLVVYIVRVALVVLLVAAAPLALICHAWPPVDGMAQLWWRGFIALLAIQLGQSFVLVTALRVFLASGSSGATFGLFTGSGLVDLLVTLCLFWVLIKIPSWASRAVFNGRGSGGGTVRRVVRTVVELKVIRAISAAL